MCLRAWELFFFDANITVPKKVIRSLESQRNSLFNSTIFGLGQCDIFPEKTETWRKKRKWMKSFLNNLSENLLHLRRLVAQKNNSNIFPDRLEKNIEKKIL